MKSRSMRYRITMAAVVALAGALAVPGEAFACWNICVNKHGYRRVVDGEYYRLVSCSQTWPADSNNPITNCVYAKGW